MENFYRTSLVLAFLLSSFFLSTAQQVFKTTPTSTIGYLEYLPADYNANSNRYPIVIFLHGIGERGTNSTDPSVLATSIQSVTKLGPPNYVKNGHSFPFILISPQLKNNFGTWPSWYVKEVLDYVKTYLRVDERRIYITGLSLGGGGTWVAAQDFPELFAAIAPVCGGYNSTSKACGIASENLPVWAFHGDADKVVPLSRSVNMVNAINACQPAPSPLAKMTIYPGVAHDSWKHAYRVDHAMHNPNVYEWLLSYKNNKNRGNSLPVANAGADKKITLPSTKVILYGGGTDADGSVASFQWSQLSGPAVASLSNASTKTLTASGLVEGTYEFRISVTDNSGNTDSDYTKVVIAKPDNYAPTVNAGPNKVITLPVNSTTLTATASDTDGTIVSFAWTKVAGSAAVMSNTAAASLSISGMEAGSYTFRCTVTDDEGAKKSDDVLVTVNHPPVVNAGDDAMVRLPSNSISITGVATDIDGTIKWYAWSKLSGPTASLAGTATAVLTASNLVQGIYVFRLTATDNRGAKKTDDVRVTVEYALENIAPVANAGVDQSITLPTNTLNLYGSGSDADGTVRYYKWSKLSGPYAYMYGVSKSTLQLSKLVAGSYLFRLTVTDEKGATGTDEVQVIVNNAVAIAQQYGGLESYSPESQQTVLGALTETDLKDATVIIYNERGKELFQGAWESESFQELFGENGFYIYSVVKHGSRIATGKIVVR